MVLRRLEQPNVWEFSWLAESEIIPDTRVPHEVTVEVLRDRGLAARRIGVDKAAYFFTVEEYEALVASLPEATFVNAAGLVEQARLVKSEAEIDIMRGCARMLDGGMRAGVDAVRAGATEDDIAAEVHRVLVGAGSEYPSLPHFICSGPRLSMPHATWRGRVLEKGDPVFFELSATKYRYSASLMLTACDGEPEPRVRHFADACLAGLQAAKDTIAPGVTCEEVDAALHGRVREGRHRSVPRPPGRLLDRPRFPARLGRGAYPQLEAGRATAARAEHDLPPGARCLHLPRDGGGLQRDGPRHR